MGKTLSKTTDGAVTSAVDFYKSIFSAKKKVLRQSTISDKANHAQFFSSKLAS